VTGTLGITVYGCARDEAELFHELSPRFGVVPAITSDAVSDTSVISGRGTDASVWDTSPRFPGERFAR
jgi:hypothetical protein